MKIFYLMVIIFNCSFFSCDGVNLGKDSAQRPVIDKLYATRPTILVSNTTTLYVEARDLNGESLDYVWTSLDGGGFVSDNGLDSIQWQAPTTPGFYTIRCRVNNESQESRSQDLDIQVTNVSTPIIEISTPSSGDFIPASTGNVAIHATVTNVTPTSAVDSMKCFIDNSFIGKVTSNGDFSFNWNVTGLNGPKTIKVQAWTRVLTNPQSTTTDSTLINVSIEGTVGKRKR